MFKRQPPPLPHFSLLTNIHKESYMKVAVSAERPGANSLLDSRFGRAAYFVIYDSRSGLFSCLENSKSLDAVQGAGIQAADTVLKAGVDAVITGHCGPKAYNVLQKAGIKVYLSKSKTINEAIRLLNEDKLEISKEADVAGHWG